MLMSEVSLYWPSFQQEGTTPLLLAVAADHLDCVKELLDQGADPNRRRMVSIL